MAARIRPSARIYTTTRIRIIRTELNIINNLPRTRLERKTRRFSPITTTATTHGETLASVRVFRHCQPADRIVRYCIRLCTILYLCITCRPSNRLFIPPTLRQQANRISTLRILKLYYYYFERRCT